MGLFCTYVPWSVQLYLYIFKQCIMPVQCHTQNHQKAQMILETTNETIGYMLICNI